MGKPAARMTDMTAKGGPIVQGSATVLIGDAGGKACSVCPGGMTKGSPVNPMLGAKVLVGGEDLDFALPGPLPVVWQRQYSSYVNSEHGAVCGLLGYGWKLGFEISVRLEEDRTLLFDAAGRVITFPEALQPGQAMRSASEDLWLMRGGGMGLGKTVAALTSTDTAGARSTATANVATNAAANTPEELLPWTEQACWSHVPAKIKADPAFVLAVSGNGRTVWAMLPVPVNAPSESNPPNKATHHLVGLLDQFGRHQQYHYDEHGRVQRIEDGVGRRYVLLYNQDKPQPTKPPAASAEPALVGTVPSLLGLDSGLRLTGVDLVYNPLDIDHTSALPGRAKPIPLVRYRYNALGDLSEVYGRDGQRTRQFGYDTAHRMVAHRVGVGPGHSYVYEDQTPAAQRISQDLRPGARVVEQHNEEGLSYFFEYRDAPVSPEMTATVSTAPPTSQVLVRDSLNRVSQYHFEGSGGDKRLTRVVNPDGSCESYQYNGTGQRLAATDALGRTTYWRYDGLGRLLGIQGPDGKSSHQTWGAVGSSQDGLVLQSTSPSGVVTRYAYDALGRLTEITSAADTDVASTTRLEYVQDLAAAVLPWCDQPIALIDAQGGRKTITYNQAGQMSSYTDCSGKTSRWHFDAWGELVEEVNALNQRVIHQRDLMGRLQQTQRPDGSTLQYRWGGNNEVQAVTVSGVTTDVGTSTAGDRNVASTTVTYTHDLWGRMTTQTQAGHSLALRYDVAGRLLELINENQASTRFTYDVQDRLLQEVGFDGRSQSYAYDAVGRLIDKIDSQDSGMAAANQGPQTVRSRYHYDNAGRMVARLMAKWGDNKTDKQAQQLEVHRFTYDDAGELVRAQSWSATLEEPALQPWLQLSSSELQTLLTNPQDESVLELAAQLQVQQLQASSRVALQRDKLGRTTGETQTLYRLGLLNDKATHKGANNAQGESGLIKSGEPPVEFEHHIAHRLGALGQRQGTQLQGMGQLDWLSYGSGHVHGVLLNQTPLIHLERDSLHREVGRTLHVLVDQENAQENPQHVKHPAIELTRELDPLGRLLQQRWQGLAVGLQNNPASQPLVGGMQGHHASLGKLALRRYSYDGLGQLIGVQTPGDATLYQYDAQQRLIGMTHADSQGERSQRWRMDAAGNRLPEPKNQGQPGQKTDWSQQVQQNLANPEFDLLKPEGSQHNSSGEVQRWKTNRVEFSTDPNGNTTHYRYDAHGNRTQATNADGSKMLLHYDALHQLIRVEQFSAAGQLQSTTSYRYDAFGRRMAKTHQPVTQEAAQTHYFGWDGDRLVHTEDSSLIRHTVYEPGSFVPLLQLQQAKGHKTEAELLMSEIQDDEDPDAMRLENMTRAQRELLQEVLAMAMQPGGNALQGLPIGEEASEMLAESVAALKAAHDASAKAHPVTIRHYLTDHLGTPIALVDANGDKAGQITWAASYNAWGNIKEEFNPHNLKQPIRLQGQQIDSETGLHYNRYRYYDPYLGRYVTQDPIGLNGGVNVFLYPVDPLGWIDPMGLDETTWRIPFGPKNGNWGGMCWSGGKSCTSDTPGTAPPLDSGDRAYMNHDKCYEKAGGNISCVKKCDKKLVDELKSLPEDSKKWPEPPRKGTEGDSESYRRSAIRHFVDPANK